MLKCQKVSCLYEHGGLNAKVVQVGRIYKFKDELNECTFRDRTIYAICLMIHKCVGMRMYLDQLDDASGTKNIAVPQKRPPTSSKSCL